MDNGWNKTSERVPEESYFVWIALNDGITVTTARYIADRNIWTSIRDIYDTDSVKYWRKKEPEPIHPDIEVES